MEKYGITAPRQERSRRSLDRLVSASIGLMSEGSFDDASITEIIRKADYSVGAFYGRFDGKDALFHLVQERVLKEAKEWVDQQVKRFSDKMDRSKKGYTVHATAAFVVETLCALYTRNRGAYRAIFLHTRVKQDKALTMRVHEFNGWCLERANHLFYKVDSSGPSAQTLKRWQLGLNVVSAYLRETILFGEVIPTGSARRQKSGLAELTKLYVSYVEA